MSNIEEKNLNQQPNFSDEEDYVSGESYQEQINSLQPEREITWKQKIAVVFLIIFGISAMILWSMQFVDSLQGKQAEIKDNNTDNKNQEKNIANNSTQDTDHDGLNDSDELKLFNTSPYLEDTDSDGINDKVEIEQGSDPNCPTGQDCANIEQITPKQVDSSANNSEDSSSEQDLLNQVSSDGEVGLDADTGISQDSIQKILGGGADAQTLRIIMEQAGIDKNILEQISDEDLMRIYSENTR